MYQLGEKCDIFQAFLVFIACGQEAFENVRFTFEYHFEVDANVSCCHVGFTRFVGNRVYAFKSAEATIRILYRFNIL